MKISIISPIYNEGPNLKKLHTEIVTMCQNQQRGNDSFTWEIIFVDDGSEDDTEEVCKTLHPLKYIRLDRNYGQTAALDCGFKAAKGDFIAALDGDGQNDPADIPYMLQYLLDHDLDVVSGWRRNRRDPLRKKAASRIACLLRQIMVHDGIHDSGCTLKVYRRECFDGLTLHADQHRFIPAILKSRGFKIGEVEVNHRPREHGNSKYHASRILKGLRDLSEIRAENRKDRHK